MSCLESVEISQSFLSRIVILTVPWFHSPQICENIFGQLWHLTNKNGTVTKFKSKLLFASLNQLNFLLPTRHGFDSFFVRPHFQKLDQPTVLDLVSANHQSLEKISQITDQNRSRQFSSRPWVLI